MVSRGPLVAALSLLFAASLAAAAVTVQGGGLTLAFSPQTGQPATGGLTLREGKALTPVQFGPAQELTQQEQAVAFSRREEQGGLVVGLAARGGEAIRLDLSFRNEGAAQRLLDVSYAVPAPGAGLTWWDGRYAAKPRPAGCNPADMGLRVPMSVAWNATHGVALGLDPHCLLSVFGTGAEATSDGLLLSFRTRLVLDPGQTVHLPLWACRFAAHFGELDAVQRWYELYPDSFTMAPGVRPSLVGGGGYLLSRMTTRELQWEQARRFGMGWEWAYCPAQTPGDWYADERFYDPNKGYAGQTDAHRNTVKGSLADYRRDMRERFQRGWWGTNLAFYMLPHAADESVLAKFPDGIIKDAAGEPDKAMIGWIKPDATTHMTYPWGNSYGQEVVREIKQIADDFGPAAIGFDEAYGAAPQYGAGIAGEPGRAWDDEGRVYASTQVALARLGDAIHANRVRGYTLAAVFNKPTSFNTATRCDVAMHEHPPYENEDAIVPQRLLMGHKPMSWWSPLKVWEILKWQELPPATLREAMQGMYAFVRLSSLRYGAFPMGHQVWGNRQIVMLMPVMAELLREGWQPTPALTGPGDLWLSRYGMGVNSFLVAGNPNREPRSGALTVLTSYLGPGHFLYADYAGAPLSARSTGEHAALDLGSLGRHEHRLARALVQLVPHDAVSVTGSAQFTREPLETGTTRASWTLSRPATGSLAVYMPHDATALRLEISGQARRFTVEGNIVRAEGPLPQRGELVLTWQPPVVVAATRAQLLGFPFEQSGQALAQIVLPAQPTDHDQFLAQWLRAYFDYWYRRQVNPSGAVAELADVPARCVLPIVPAATVAGGKPRVMLSAQGTDARLALAGDGSSLTISGPTPQLRERAVRRLLEILDEKYPYQGAYPDAPIYQRAGLVGRVLE